MQQQRRHRPASCCCCRSYSQASSGVPAAAGLLLLLLVLPWADGATAVTGAEPQVVVQELPAAFKHAQADADMEPLYRACLEPDLAPHAGRAYTLRDVAATVRAQKSVRYWKHLSLVVVRGAQVHAATLSPSGAPPSPTPRRVNMTIQAVLNASKLGVHLPDCVFILSTWDEPRCPVRTPSRCPAPVLALVKSWLWEGPNQGSSEHTDVLVPFFNHVYQQVVDYPWASKVPKALMRAAMQNGMPPRNTRLALVELSRSAEGGRLLDAGITHNLKETMTLETVPQVSLPDHARWRFLVSADGYSASCRLGKLLGINSVVLKEVTPWVEHYYRALVPGTHFVPFTRQNALQVLKEVHAMPEAEQREIARRAREFQQLYLTQHAKVLYLRQVLVRYVQLFPGVDMARFVRGLDASRLHDLKYLLQELDGAA